MQQDREDLDILFRRTSPEAVLKILDNFQVCNIAIPELDVRVNSYQQEAYEHFGLFNLQNYSPDEIGMRYSKLKRNMNDSGDGVYVCLYQFADKVLDMEYDNPICRLKEILNWNSISSRLGQDIFTTAWLAKRDFNLPRCRVQKKFDWPSIIKTNDNKLNMMLKKGLAENHYHLNGSTQSFALAWACLMNHPNLIKKRFAENVLKENLTPGVNLGTMDNTIPMSEKITYAALIRKLLFERCLGISTSTDTWHTYCEINKPILAFDIGSMIDSTRQLYGSSFLQLNGHQKCLDYAICKELYHVEPDSNVRLLAGERSFLFHCFLLQFQQKFSAQESTMFYLYLLIKSHLWQEMIQINKRVGFSNFSRYQDRKDKFYDGCNEYWTEAQRLSVCEAVQNNHVNQLEARIMPSRKVVDMTNKIMDYDRRILFSDRYLKKDEKLFDEKKQIPFFYVLHFPKESIYKSGMNSYPRNSRTRKDAKEKAKTLVRFRKKNRVLASRVLGIDACSNEIGCRPETFATEFRFLRDDDEWNAYVDDGVETYTLNKLHITYHVGEDFLDIADGLRAVDEAICFLPLKRNDRIGHGLVLGTDPVSYYKKKKYTVYMNKQDCLDNCVWLLYRSLEWNIPIDTNNREFLKREARRLLAEIYDVNKIKSVEIGDIYFDDILNVYYNSWKIRGDHPDLYKTGEYIKRDEYSYDPYEHYMETKGISDLYRKNPMVASFYHLYHYDETVREKGLQAECVQIREWYIELMEHFQKHIRKRINDMGIYIECNPTSNILIGNFELYEEHPIFKFHACSDETEKNEPRLSVSINTDDLGVFSTSLENEYALLLSALCRKRNREGNYNNQVAYDYFEEIRQKGVEMSFALQDSSQLMTLEAYEKETGINHIIFDL